MDVFTLEMAKWTPLRSTAMARQRQVLSLRAALALGHSAAGTCSGEKGNKDDPQNSSSTPACTCKPDAHPRPAQYKPDANVYSAQSLSLPTHRLPRPSLPAPVQTGRTSLPVAYKPDVHLSPSRTNRTHISPPRALPLPFRGARIIPRRDRRAIPGRVPADSGKGFVTAGNGEATRIPTAGRLHGRRKRRASPVQRGCTA